MSHISNICNAEESVCVFSYHLGGEQNLKCTILVGSNRPRGDQNTGLLTLEKNITREEYKCTFGKTFVHLICNFFFPKVVSVNETYTCLHPGKDCFILTWALLRFYCLSHTLCIMKSGKSNPGFMLNS